MSRIRLAAAVALVGTGIVVACSQLDSPAAQRRLPHALSQEIYGPSYRSLSAAQVARIQSAKAAGAWVADLHHEVIVDVLAKKSSLRNASRGQKCETVFQIVASHINEARIKGHLTASEAAIRSLLVQSVANDKRCAGTNVMSIFGSDAFGLFATPSLSMIQDDPDTIVTQAGVDFAQAVADAANNSSGLPDGVAAATDEVLATGTSLGPADFDLGAAQADEAVSSSEQWYEYGESGGFSGSGGDSTAYYQSVLPMQWWAVLVSPIAKVDALGCAGGAAAAYIGGVRGIGYLTASCWVGGALTSGSAVLLE